MYLMSYKMEKLDRKLKFAKWSTKDQKIPFNCWQNLTFFTQVLMGQCHKEVYHKFFSPWTNPDCCRIWLQIRGDIWIRISLKSYSRGQDKKKLLLCGDIKKFGVNDIAELAPWSHYDFLNLKIVEKFLSNLEPLH